MEIDVPRWYRPTEVHGNNVSSDAFHGEDTVQNDSFELSYLIPNFRIAVFFPASHSILLSFLPPFLLRFSCLLIYTVTCLEHITFWKLRMHRTATVCDNLSLLNAVLHSVCGLSTRSITCRKRLKARGVSWTLATPPEFVLFIVVSTAFLSAESSLPSLRSKTNGRCGCNSYNLKLQFLKWLWWNTLRQPSLGYCVYKQIGIYMFLNAQAWGHNDGQRPGTQNPLRLKQNIWAWTSSIKGSWICVLQL